MAELFDYRITPWSNLYEFVSVYTSIYQSIRFQYSKFSGELVGKTFAVKDQSNYDYVHNRLKMAHERVCDWRIRCSNCLSNNINISLNAKRFILFVQQHLTSIESQINVLMEEFKLEYKEFIERTSPTQMNTNNRLKTESQQLTSIAKSVINNLYSMSIIHFSSVIESYSNQVNIRSVKSIARKLKCPEWIIECRNKLSHPQEGNMPSQEKLSHALAYILEWMEIHFWRKLIQEQRPTIKQLSLDNLFRFLSENHFDCDNVNIPSQTEHSVSQQSAQHVNLNAMIQMAHCAESEFVSDITASILFDPFKTTEEIKKISSPNFKKFIGNFPIIYSRLLAKFLMFDVPEHYPNFQNSMPLVFVKRLGYFLFQKIIFPNKSPSQLQLHLFSLLNALTSNIIELQRIEFQQKNADPDCMIIETDKEIADRKISIQIGYQWLCLFIVSISKVLKNEETSNDIETSFKVYKGAKLQNQVIVWYRLFHTLSTKIKPNKILIKILITLYESFLKIIIPANKYEQIIKLMDIAINGGLMSNDDTMKKTYTVEDFLNNNNNNIKRKLEPYNNDRDYRYEWSSTCIGSNIVKIPNNNKKLKLN